jgi:hypothetical protein
MCNTYCISFLCDNIWTKVTQHYERWLSGFRNGADEVYVLLSYCPTSLDGWCSKFRVKMFSPSSGVECPLYNLVGCASEERPHREYLFLLSIKRYPVKVEVFPFSVNWLTCAGSAWLISRSAVAVPRSDSHAWWCQVAESRYYITCSVAETPHTIREEAFVSLRGKVGKVWRLFIKLGGLCNRVGYLEFR